MTVTFKTTRGTRTFNDVAKITEQRGGFYLNYASFKNDYVPERMIVSGPTITDD